MMWAIHVQVGVTPRNLVASIFAVNVREARHIAITSSMIQQVCMCVRMHSYVKQQTCISAPETRARPKTAQHPAFRCKCTNKLSRVNARAR